MGTLASSHRLSTLKLSLSESEWCVCGLQLTGDLSRVNSLLLLYCMYTVLLGTKQMDV